MPTLARDGDVFVLNLGNGENRFNPEWVGGVEALLDEVDAAPPPRALVTTATGKFFSNGLDLDWMAAHSEQLSEFVPRVHRLFARVLAFGAPTVAALQGHTFAAGAMIALAHDFRVMRADRGFFCLPEVEIRIPFTRGMTALVAARMPTAARHEAMTMGRRYGGVEAAAAGIVQHAVPEDQVVPRALEIASALAGKDPATLREIKERLYADVLVVLNEPVTMTGLHPS